MRVNYNTLFWKHLVIKKVAVKILLSLYKLSLCYAYLKTKIHIHLSQFLLCSPIKPCDTCHLTISNTMHFARGITSILTVCSP